MPEYWLDADVFISPNRQGFYSLDLAPSYWELLERKASDGILASPMRVYQELVDHGDSLSAWATDRRDSGLFIEEDQDVQAAMTRVADYVIQNYQGHKAQESLGGADPWVIAHALSDNSIAVTYESRVNVAS